MVKKTITYLDYNDKPITEDFYFNMSRVDMMDFNFDYDGGMKAYIEKIVAEEDNKKIYYFFKELLLKSYGKKSADGKRFVKNEEATQEFAESEALSELIFKLMNDENEAAAFVNGIIPKEFTESK